MFDIGALACVGKGEGADIMEQRRDAHMFVKKSGGILRFGIKELIIWHSLADGAHYLICHMHHTKGVGEAVMLCSWENIIGEAELLDPAQALVKGRVDNFIFGIC